jgi:hypothetical protein
VLAGNTLLVATRDYVPRGHLLALDAATGAERWRLRLDEASLSTPAVYGDEIYLGTESGSIVAVHRTAPGPVHLAVFHDSTFGPFSVRARMMRDYFAYAGYQVLSADSLDAFLNARISDGAPSVVVFATEWYRRGPLPPVTDTILFRRYLVAGGKIVWPGRPLAFDVRDSSGTPIGMNPREPERLLGVPFNGVSFSEHAAMPTPTGRQWGIDRWVRGGFGIPPGAATHALTLDETGLATAWVKSFRADRPGSGYVQLWGFGAAPDRLEMIRQVAEYGLLRRAGS